MTKTQLITALKKEASTFQAICAKRKYEWTGGADPKSVRWANCDLYDLDRDEEIFSAYIGYHTVPFQNLYGHTLIISLESINRDAKYCKLLPGFLMTLLHLYLKNYPYIEKIEITVENDWQGIRDELRLRLDVFNKLRRYCGDSLIVTPVSLNGELHTYALAPPHGNYDDDDIALLFLQSMTVKLTTRKNERLPTSSKAGKTKRKATKGKVK